VRLLSHVSNVEWRKVLENFRAAYQSMYPAEILVIEVIANSLDAGATHIALTVSSSPKELQFRVTDNGRGMRSKDEFERYHDLGSLTKSRGGTIGWAGIGAKLYLDQCEQVYTETKSASFAASSDWSFRAGDKAPQWDEVKPEGLVPYKTGTTVEVSIAKHSEWAFFGEETLKRLVLQNYNYAMKPYGAAEIKIGDTNVEPFDPKGASSTPLNFELQLKSGEKVSGCFSLSSEAVPVGFELVSIVVNGKTVGEQHDFKQLARIKNIYRVTGFVRCDSLVQIVTTSKDSFNRKTPLWFEFSKKVGARFSDWLEKCGELSKLERDTDLEALAAELGKDLNRVFARPEIRALGLDLFQALAARKVAIRNESGEQKVKETDGSQTTTGTMGGSGEGAGVPTEGDEPGKGVRTDSSGDLPAVERTRRTRGGVNIAYVSQPDRPERAWADPGLAAILINQAHPAFQCADGLSSIPYYTAECCFTVVSESIESPEERDAIMRKLFLAFLTVAS
jgi:hypothetical protein